MERQRLVVAVWKEKLNFSQSVQSAKQIDHGVRAENWPFITAVAPNPFSFVGVAEVLRSSPVRLCAQNVLWNATSGSYIAETTTGMLREVGCHYVIVGHSERRLHFGESNEMIANRALSAVEAGIKPILCVGDTAEDLEKGRSETAITNQLRPFLQQVSGKFGPTDFYVAYEPVWAISTWRNDQPLPNGTEVQRLHSFLRNIIASLRGLDFANGLSLLYGGSVSGENGEDYMQQADVDGALVGGASKTPDSFLKTLQACRLGFNRRRASLQPAPVIVPA